MRAIVFADRPAAPLAPLDARYAIALLPVAGRPLVMWTIKDLVAAGVGEVTLVVAEQAERVETMLPDCNRLGVQTRLVRSEGGQRPSVLWPRLEVTGDAPLLVLRGDLLRSRAVSMFLERAAEVADQPCWGLCGAGELNLRSALLWVRTGQAELPDLLDCLHWDEPSVPDVGEVVRLREVEINYIEHLKHYHRANLDLMAGRLPGLIPPGRVLAPGLRAGRGATVLPGNLRGGQAYVGAHSEVHRDAELMREVVIGDHVLVAEGATIYDSVVLPYTYVGELLEVSNAIAAANLLIRVDSGAVLDVVDPFLLGRLGFDAGTGTRRADQLIGVALLLLSLPLWPVALLAALIAPDGPGGPIRRQELVGNLRDMRQLRESPSGLTPEQVAQLRGEVAFARWRFATRVPLLSLLPAVLDLIRGHLRLVGVSPLTLAESIGRREPWQQVRDEAPVGLIGPTQLRLRGDAPLESRLLSDAFYAGRRSRLGDLSWVARGLLALLRKRTWRRSAPDAAPATRSSKDAED